MEIKVRSARARRAAVESLSRDRLDEITAKFDLAVDDRRAVASHVDAIMRSRTVDFGDFLRLLSRDELKAICEILGLDTSGREKELLVSRILDAQGNRDDRQKLDLSVQEPAAPKRKTRGAQMPLKPKTPPGASGGQTGPFADYRHDDKRKNNPPAGLIDLDKPPPQPRKTYAYDPHLDPAE